MREFGVCWVTDLLCMGHGEESTKLVMFCHPMFFLTLLVSPPREMKLTRPSPVATIARLLAAGCLVAGARVVAWALSSPPRSQVLEIRGHEAGEQAPAMGLLTAEAQKWLLDYAGIAIDDQEAQVSEFYDRVHAVEPFNYGSKAFFITPVLSHNVKVHQDMRADIEARLRRGGSKAAFVDLGAYAAATEVRYLLWKGGKEQEEQRRKQLWATTLEEGIFELGFDFFGDGGQLDPEHFVAGLDITNASSEAFDRVKGRATVLYADNLFHLLPGGAEAQYTAADNCLRLMYGSDVKRTRGWNPLVRLFRRRKRSVMYLRYKARARGAAGTLRREPQQGESSRFKGAGPRWATTQGFVLNMWREVSGRAEWKQRGLRLKARVTHVYEYEYGAALRDPKNGVFYTMWVRVDVKF